MSKNNKKGKPSAKDGGKGQDADDSKGPSIY
jgi:hypothetical protein